MNNQHLHTIIYDQNKEIAKLKKDVIRHELFGLEMIHVWVNTSNKSSLKKLAEIQDMAEQKANLLYP